MKETPILFSAPMVRAILEGRKNRTRRIVKMTKDEIKDATWGYTGFTPPGKISVRGYHADGRYGESFIDKPFHAGDILWVREEHYAYGWWVEVEGGFTKTGKQKWQFIRSDDTMWPIYYADTVPDCLRIQKNNRRQCGWHKRLGRFMFKKDARIWLEVTDVRVQRVQEISEADAISEGVLEVTKDGKLKKYCVYDHKDYSSTPWSEMPGTAKEAYGGLWQSINGAESWEANPWVWAITFKVLSTTGKPENL